MYDNYRIVVVCPAGRRELLDIMRRYVERERPLVDEFHLWINTDNRDDLAYMYSLAAADPNFYFLVSMPKQPRFNRRHKTICYFFRFAIDPDTIYIRIDDDVCWMTEGCLEALVAHRLAYPDAYLVYGNIANSSHFMALHQQAGAFDPGFKIEYALSHATNRLSIPAALAAHRAFLLMAEDLAAGGNRQDLLAPWICFDRHIFEAGRHNDVNMISWFGKDFAEWKGICPPQVFEETWICLNMPCKYGGRIHEACGAALCSHYASLVQYPGLTKHPDILERYRKLQPDSDIRWQPRSEAVISLPRVDAVS